MDISYNEIRDKIKLGDLIAFSGKGIFSEIIKGVTKSDISHVGVILVSYVYESSLVQVIESTSLGKGFAGVMINRLSDHIRDYNGKIWLYPLKDELYDKMDLEAYTSFLLKQKGKPYDLPQAIFSAIDFIFDNDEDFENLYCSELCTAAYEEVELLKDINASEVTPADLVAFDLYQERILLKA